MGNYNPSAVVDESRLRQLTKVRMRQIEKDTASPTRLIHYSELDELYFKSDQWDRLQIRSLPEVICSFCDKPFKQTWDASEQYCSDRCRMDAEDKAEREIFHKAAAFDVLAKRGWFVKLDKGLYVVGKYGEFPLGVGDTAVEAVENAESEEPTEE